MDDVYTLPLSNGSQYPYRIIHSKRAKYIRIKLSQQGDLSVTIPYATAVKHAHEFVFSKIVWIEKNLAKANFQAEKKLPTTLDLKLLNESWSILYTESDRQNANAFSGLLKLQEKQNLQLEIQGPQKQLNYPVVVAKTLNHWCKKKAKAVFNIMLQELAELHGFHYQRLSIRSQKTRWGSCSHKKNINLNCKLLFMPEAVTRYVMIHELCHTIEMNHSKRFWALVEDCDPQFRMHKKELKELGKGIAI